MVIYLSIQMQSETMTKMHTHNIDYHSNALIEIVKFMLRLHNNMRITFN